MVLYLTIAWGTGLIAHHDWQLVRRIMAKSEG